MNGYAGWLLGGMLLVIAACIINGWIMVACIVKMGEADARTKHIESTRFTWQDGQELRNEVEKNRNDLLINRKIGEDNPVQNVQSIANPI